MDTKTFFFPHILRVLLAIGVLVALFLSNLYSVLLFHSLAEIFSIIMAGAVFVLAWNFRRFYSNSFQPFIGTAFLSVSLIDLFHTLSYPGMGIFVGYDNNLNMQLWLTAHMLQSLALLCAPHFLHRKVKMEWLLFGFSLITVLLLYVNFAWDVFPVLYNNGIGLTPAKIFAEYLVVIILAAAVFNLLRHRRSIDRLVLHRIIVAIAFMMATEVAFTLYSDTFSLPYQIGYFMKLIASYLVYKAIVETEAGSIYVDMTRFQETERALLTSTRELRESEIATHRNLAELHSIYANAPIGLCFLDTNLRFQAINEALASLNGLPVAEHLGKSFHVVLSNEIADQIEPFLQQVLKTGRPVLNQVVSAHSRTDPTLISYWLASYHPVYSEDGHILGISSVVQDETERRHAEMALQASERTLKLFIEYAPTAIAMLDREMRYIAASRRYLQDYCIAEQNIVGRSHYEIFPEISEQWKEIYRCCLTGSVEKKDEDLFPRSDGTLDWVRWEIHPWYDLTGEIGGIIIFSEVITKRKRAEEELAEVHAALQAYAEKLKRSNQELEQFAMVASHDLQEPLRKVIFFGMELQSYAQDLSEEAKDYLNRMQSAVERMQVMIAGLLELSRVNTRGGNFTQVNLTSVVKEVIFDLEASIQSSGGQVILDPLPSAEVDEIQIRRLFQNLIGNALKFHKPDVSPIVRITDRTEPSTSRDSITIAVEDNGIGLEEQYTERIFQPFQRLHGKSEYEGTGLGLAISQKITERHRGNLEVHSQPGQGSVFSVTLPVHQPGS